MEKVRYSRYLIYYLIVSFPSLKIINTPNIFLDPNNENLLSLKRRTKKYHGTCRWNTKKKRNNRIFSSFQTNEISKNRIFFFFFLFFANYYIRVRMRAPYEYSSIPFTGKFFRMGRHGGTGSRRKTRTTRTMGISKLSRCTCTYYKRSIDSVGRAHRAVNFHRSHGSKNAMGNRSMRSYESHSRNNKCIVWPLP